ncbi:VCBS repeat-containing protein [Nannocystis sp. RBIL2]|uniref:FG-GAP repeat domain-containing protein n=1 Tax=Nannocystis sp. RBIL2 TaxID=2996788 RepID=UPI00226DD554|nr:VCBS repeat-containing protein [Nannocystis sp. RBIL2]
MTVLFCFACGPAAPGEDSEGAPSEPGTTTHATSDGAETTASTGVDPSGFDPSHVTTSSECRSLDIPCPGWCAYDEGCPLGHVCVDASCTVAPTLPTCDELALVAVDWGLPHAPGALALVDLDSDGDLDLAVVEPAAAQLEIFHNDGAGAFTPGGAVALGPPFELPVLATGDLDGDADIDLVLARADAGEVMVLLADQGTWVAGPMLAGSVAAQLFVADVDGFDGRDVLAVSLGDPALTLWRGDGLGGFAERQDMPVSLTPLASLVDVTLDGLPDVIGPDPFGVAIYRARPSSWFDDEVGFGFGGYEVVYHQALATQLDATPELELVTLLRDPAGSVIHVLRQSADSPSGFSPFDHGLRPGATPTSARVADITGDGHPDLVAVTTSDALMLLPGDGDGGFVCEGLVPMPARVTHDLLAVGDVDGDAHPDIVAASPSSPALWVFHGL